MFWYCKCFCEHVSVTIKVLKLSFKVLMKHVSLSSLSNVVACQWRFGENLWQMLFIKKQTESLNSVWLKSFPLANRYPDDKVSSLSLVMFSWHQQTLWAPFIDEEALDVIKSFLKSHVSLVCLSSVLWAVTSCHSASTCQTFCHFLFCSSSLFKISFLFPCKRLYE